jgi:hypothetical protein
MEFISPIPEANSSRKNELGAEKCPSKPMWIGLLAIRATAGLQIQEFVRGISQM